MVEMDLFVNLNSTKDLFFVGYFVGYGCFVEPVFTIEQVMRSCME